MTRSNLSAACLLLVVLASVAPCGALPLRGVREEGDDLGLLDLGSMLRPDGFNNAVLASADNPEAPGSLSVISEEDPATNPTGATGVFEPEPEPEPEAKAEEPTPEWGELIQNVYGDVDLDVEDPASCAKEVWEVEQRFQKDKYPDAFLPSAMEHYCRSKFKALQIDIPLKFIKIVCSAGRELLDKRPEGSRYSEAQDDAVLFCREIKRVFDKHAPEYLGPRFPPTRYPTGATGGHDEWSPSHKPIATSNVPDSCCKPHDTVGCYDEIIEQCVCKVDLFCCMKTKPDGSGTPGSWDQFCSEQVEATGCGVCRYPEL